MREYNSKDFLLLLVPGIKEIARGNNGFAFYHAGKIYVAPEALVTELSEERLREFFNNDQYDKIKSLVIHTIELK